MIWMNNDVENCKHPPREQKNSETKWVWSTHPIELTYDRSSGSLYFILTKLLCSLNLNLAVSQKNNSFPRLTLENWMRTKPQVWGERKHDRKVRQKKSKQWNEAENRLKCVSKEAIFVKAALLGNNDQYFQREFVMMFLLSSNSLMQIWPAMSEYLSAISYQA